MAAWTCALHQATQQQLLPSSFPSVASSGAGAYRAGVCSTQGEFGCQQVGFSSSLQKTTLNILDFALERKGMMLSQTKALFKVSRCPMVACCGGEGQLARSLPAFFSHALESGY